MPRVEICPESYSGPQEGLSVVATEAPLQRPRVHGKFLYIGNEKLWVRGVTYGTFHPDADGNEFHDPATVERDFAQMALHGLNAVRTYTVPPRWLLDLALQYGLHIMVGLPWEQHIAFLDDKQRAQDIETRLRAEVRSCAGHPAVLCYAIGNEIPAPIVRWHGNRRIERFLKRLYLAVKSEDPQGLVTYVNYPTTEYLELPFVDLVCFNVYLETQDKLEGYLARLQNIAGDRPLIMSEVGLDSRRNGEEHQAQVLDWQVRTAFASGCAGAFVFAWTDAWHRGGHDIEDWDFGLTDRRRRPKAALETVRNAFAEVPFPKDYSWPRISVVVCTYNGSRTIRDTCEGLLQLEYPNYEVVVINDGSKDDTAAIVREYGFRLISTENRGLSSARNTGMEAAAGEIVAYIDDDAYPDPHWLTYLAAAFMHSDHVGVGGPNLAPAGDGLIADCVANSPGGPVHVLVSDREAEHIPGCNMAFRKTALQAIGGFDPRFRTAGDDVDVCWRLQERGGTLGFSPAAMVWHHRRNSVQMYWRQQKGYGRAEALLEQKWPEKYNGAGHLCWSGRLYGKGLTHALNWSRGRIYQGTWGSALFQSVYQPAQNTLWALSLMPEWYMVVAALGLLALLGTFWAPLLWVVPLFVLSVAAPCMQALVSAVRASFTSEEARERHVELRLRGLTAYMHLMQPFARLYGRIQHGLTPWRWRGPEDTFGFPWPATTVLWSEEWQGTSERLQTFETVLRDDGALVRRGGDYDRWDLEVRGGLLANARTLMAIEEHGAGKQLIRFHLWPQCSLQGVLLALLFILPALGAVFDGAWVSAVVLSVTALGVALRMLRESTHAMGALRHALTRLEVEEG